jgi:hypothetical protein
LEHSTSSKDDWYVGMLLTQLGPGATEDGRKQCLSAVQQSAVAEFLRHVLETRSDELKYRLMLEEAQEALRNWEQISHAA